MTEERVRFGGRLREEREAKSLSLAEVARVTKIPEKSLERLEAGRFDELPADVFVRGFIRSYARVVGLDAEAELRAYGELTKGVTRAPASLATGSTIPTTDAVPPPATARARLEAAAAEDTKAPIEASAPKSDPTPASAPAPAPAKVQSPEPKADLDMSTLSKAILDATSRGTRRASLTLAVIILVIVATLTLSLLLSRPSHVGDGVSRAPVSTTERADA